MSSYSEMIIEENMIKTNDIHAALMSYGVEMARALILKEIQGVFGAYNIDVDIRHLELIADYMVSSLRHLVLFFLTQACRRTTVDISHSIGKAYRRIRLLY